jgi:microsomal dipeptidase-like Zn-dependent dipeptidase
MSIDLQEILARQIEENYRRQAQMVKDEIATFKSLITNIYKATKLDIAISVEGAETSEFKKQKNHLELLEKAGLIKGATMYTHHNEFKQYTLTENGEQIAKKISEET